MDLSSAKGDSGSPPKECVNDKCTNEKNDVEIKQKPDNGKHFEIPDVSQDNNARHLMAGNRKQYTDDIEPVTDDNEQVTDDNKQVTDDNKQVIDDKQQVTHDNQQVTCDDQQIAGATEQKILTEHTDFPNTSDITDTQLAAFEDSPLSKSVDFMFETKYVMLNFMSLIPPDMYRGHLSTSPEIEPENHQRFGKSFVHLSKSKSFDISSHNRKPGLKYLGKLKSMQRHMHSPASEDNLNYRYMKNWKKLDSPGCERFNSDPGSPLSDLFEKSHSAHEISNHSSPALSPRKSFQSAHRQYSDASSSGEFSYMSDADDEYEEYSNASSIFSARSFSGRDGFLDLRRSVHVLPPLMSQSEDVDEADTFILQPDNKTEATQESGYLETLPEEIKHDSKVEPEREEDMQVEVSGNGKSRIKQSADRSKLKLNIPCEPVQLDDILLSLHTELSSEIDEMESEFEEALQSARSRMSHPGFATPLTPQSEAARVLARIGDEVKEQYGAQLAAAVNRLTFEQINSLSYSQFRNIAQSVVTPEVPGWRQVALLMVFGQKIIWGAVQQGHNHFGNLIDYCSQLVAEMAADFIIKQGGWRSVMNFDPSSDTQSSADLDTSPEMMVDYFTDHNVTQVESEKCLEGTMEEGEDNVTGIDAERDNATIEGKGETQNVELYLTTGQGITVKNGKTRYASSVGFEYTDEIEDMPETDTRSDSEQDVSVAFVEPDNAKESEETENGNTTEGQGDTIDQNSGDAECFVDESKEVQTDHINRNLSNIANDYDRDSVYIRQATPSATLFDSDVDDLCVDRDINGSGSCKEAKKDNDESEEKTDSENGINIKDDASKLKLNSGIGLEVNGNSNGADGKEKGNNDGSGIKTVNNNVVIDKKSVDGIFVEGASLDCHGGGHETMQSGDETLKSNIHSFHKGETNQTELSSDLKVLNETDKSNTNNNQDETIIDEGEEICESIRNKSIHEENNLIHKTEDRENENVRREVTEFHVPTTFRRIGFRVVALALAVLAVGISVKFTSLNRK